MSDDLKEQVERWLQEQGYPLEMRVAQALQQVGFKEHLTVGGHYEHPTAGFREVDVSVSLFKTAQMPTTAETFTLGAELLVECKRSRKAWVAFVIEDDSRHANEAASVYHWPMTTLARQRVADDISSRWSEIGEKFYQTGPTAYGLAEAATLGKPEKELEKGRPNRAYDALRQLLDAVEAHRNLAETVESSHAGFSSKRSMVLFPVIVLDGSLFEYRLADGRLELNQVEQTTVVLRDRGSGCGNPRVLIVTANQLEHFAQAAVDLCSGVTESARRYIDQQHADDEVRSLRELHETFAKLRGPDATGKG